MRANNQENGTCNIISGNSQRKGPTASVDFLRAGNAGVVVTDDADIDEVSLAAGVITAVAACVGIEALCEGLDSGGVMTTDREMGES